METELEPISKIPKAIIFYELFVGLIEFVSSVSLLILGKNILGIYENLKNTELFEDPNDLMVKLMENAIPNFFKHRTFIAIILLTFGVIKIVSGMGLVYKKVWAEYLLVIFLVFLVPFELIGLLNHFTVSEVIYLVTDITIVLYLVKFKPVGYYKKMVGDLFKKDLS